MDKYEGLRSLPFPAICQALGLDASQYRHKKDEYQGKCPIHEAKHNNNSFSYNTSGQFHCFSCNGKGKGAIDLVKLVRKCNFTDAVGLLEAVPAQQPEQTEPEQTSGVLKPYRGSYEKFKVESEWLNERTPKAIQELYGVFCYNNVNRKSAYSGRVMIPVKDVTGQLYGYLGRAIEGEPKYLFPKDLPKSSFLFGAYELSQGLVQRQDGTPYQAPLRYVYLVESPFCVMRFASLGLPAVSPYGWSVSQEQTLMCSSLAKGIVYLPDRNKYSESASQLASLGKRLWVRFPELPEGIDDPEQLDLSQILSL